MDLFYYAFGLFLGSVFLAGRYYKEPEKLMWIYLAICVGLAVYTEMDLCCIIVYFIGCLWIYSLIVLASRRCFKDLFKRSTHSLLDAYFNFTNCIYLCVVLTFL